VGLKVRKASPRMNGAELARVARQADLLGDFKLRNNIQDVSDRQRRRSTIVKCTASSERRHPHLRSGPAPAVEPKIISSMRKTGLLLSGRTVLTPTVLGPDPEQKKNGPKTTPRWTAEAAVTIIVSYLDDSHLGTTQSSSRSNTT